MANSYYTVTYDFEPFTRITSAQVDAELSSVVAGFDLLPAPTAFHSGNLGFVAAGGTANAITIANPISTWTSYTGKDGYRINIQITSDNTGAVTLAVDGLAAKSCIRNTGAALEAGDLKASGFYDFIYDEAAGNFKVLVEASSIVNADKLGSVAAANYARLDATNQFQSWMGMANNNAYHIKDVGGTQRELLKIDASDVVHIGAVALGTAVLQSNTNTKLKVGGAEIFGVTASEAQVSKQLVLYPLDGTNEGGEALFKGAGSYDDVQIDNYQGQFRIFHTRATDLTTNFGNFGAGDHNINVSGYVVASDNVYLSNTKGVLIKDAGGTDANAISLDSNDDLQIGDTTYVDNVDYYAASAGDHKFHIGGAAVVTVSNGVAYFHGNARPWTDNTSDLGAATFAWADIYSVNAPTTTSDARMKENITSLTDLSLDLINLLNPVSYKWKDYVEEVVEEAAKDEKVVLRPVTEMVIEPKLIKEWDEQRQVFVQREIEEEVERVVYDDFPILDAEGNPVLDADGEPVVEQKQRMEGVVIPASEAVTREQEHTHVRTHYGLIAQEVEQALITAGLDPNQIGAFIHDRENDRYAVRYTELIAPMIKAIQVLSSKNDDLEARIQTLENA